MNLKNTLTNERLPEFTNQTIDGFYQREFNNSFLPYCSEYYWCEKIKTPFVFVTGYRCKGYVLLHKLQEYLTDKVIGPETDEEFTNGLVSMDSPYSVDYYHMLHDKISISNNEDGHLLLPYDSFNRNIYLYENEKLDDFHLFKVDESFWTEVELDLVYRRTKKYLN